MKAKRPSHLRVNGRVMVVDDYDVRPHPDEAGMLEVRVLGYDQDRDESITVTLAMPPREDDPTEPRWPADPTGT
jgi:hypothetical protein